MSDPKNPETPDQPEVPSNRARRRLLKLIVYVPPTVLGVVSLQQSGCAPNPSCNPSTCNPATQPCNPDNTPCGPNTGCNPDNCAPNV